MRPLITAFRTLTIIPLPGKDAQHFSNALPLFWIVGVAISLIPISCAKLSDVGIDAGIAAIVAVFLVTVVTGGLHVDGLADSCDGFGGGRGNKERILEIFKDSRLGTFGVIAVVFDLLFKVLAWQLLFKSSLGVLAISVSLVLSRTIQSILLVWLPNARGTSSLLHAFSSTGNFMKSSIFIPFIVVAFAGAQLFRSHLLIISISTVVSLFGVLLFSLYCLKKIGGMTGDTIGASNEIAEIVFLFTAILLMNIPIISGATP